MIITIIVKIGSPKVSVKRADFGLLFDSNFRAACCLSVLLLNKTSISLCLPLPNFAFNLSTCLCESDATQRIFAPLLAIVYSSRSSNWNNKLLLSIAAVHLRGEYEEEEVGSEVRRMKMLTATAGWPLHCVILGREERQCRAHLLIGGDCWRWARCCCEKQCIVMTFGKQSFLRQTDTVCAKSGGSSSNGLSAYCCCCPPAPFAFNCSSDWVNKSYMPSKSLSKRFKRVSWLRKWDARWRMEEESRDLRDFNQ